MHEDQINNYNIASNSEKQKIIQIWKYCNEMEGVDPQTPAAATAAPEDLSAEKVKLKIKNNSISTFFHDVSKME